MWNCSGRGIKRRSQHRFIRVLPGLRGRFAQRSWRTATSVDDDDVQTPQPLRRFVHEPCSRIRANEISNYPALSANLVSAIAQSFFIATGNYDSGTLRSKGLRDRFAKSRAGTENEGALPGERQVHCYPTLT
jgi:hypothetical protein